MKDILWILGTFVGFVILLRKTRRQSKQIDELKRSIERLEMMMQPQDEETPSQVLLQPPLELIPLEAEDPLRETRGTVLGISEPETPDRTVPSLGNSLKGFIHGGNLWAAGGVILLLAAFAMLITYLARHGFFTLEMGIAAAALSGIAMLCFGWRFRLQRPLYFLVLQGGGIGILYLSVFAAHKLTPYFPTLLSLILMSLLIPLAVMLALVQHSQPLALLGFFGGFAAPILLAAGEGNHVFLFSYYLVLDLGVLIIGYYRFWKGLTLWSLLCTFGSALFWVMTRYEKNLFWTAEPFFISFIIIFTLLGMQGLGKDRLKDKPYSTAALILAVPLLGALIQWNVFSYISHGHAIISILFSAFYVGLALLIWKYRERFGKEAIRPFAEAYLGLSVALGNVAIPLELSPGITSVIWAAEGALAVFLSLRYRNVRIRIGGFLLHIAAALAFGLGSRDSQSGAFRSSQFTGSLIMAIAALVMILLIHSYRLASAGEENPPNPSKDKKDFTRRKKQLSLLAFTLWAFIWWFYGWFFEFNRIAVPPFELLLGLPWAGGACFILSSLTGLGVFVLARYFRCPYLNIGIIPSLIFALLKVLGSFSPVITRGTASLMTTLYAGTFYNFFEGIYLWAWLAFFAIHLTLLLLSRNNPEETGTANAHGVWLFTVILITIAVLTFTGRACTKYLGLPPSLTSFTGIIPSLGTLAGISFLSKSSSKVSLFHRKLLFFMLPLILCGILGLWFLVTLFWSGNPKPLPFYIPIINPLDLQQGFCIAGIVLWLLQNRKMTAPIVKDKSFILGDLMVFLWITGIIARSVHFYGKPDIPSILTPVISSRILASPSFHLGIFIFWGIYGIAHIILGHRLALRPLWIAGAILTVTDIGKLLILDLAGTGAITRIISFFIAGLILLFIGWVAPLPPPVSQDTPDG